MNRLPALALVSFYSAIYSASAKNIIQRRMFVFFQSLFSYCCYKKFHGKKCNEKEIATFMLCRMAIILYAAITNGKNNQADVAKYTPNIKALHIFEVLFYKMRIIFFYNSAFSLCKMLRPGWRCVISALSVMNDFSFQINRIQRVILKITPEFFPVKCYYKNT